MINIAEEATPDTPAAGRVRLYAKSDKSLYIKDSNGLETPVTDAAQAQQITTVGNLLLMGF